MYGLVRAHAEEHGVVVPSSRLWKAGRGRPRRRAGNSTPMPSISSRRVCSTSFSSLNGGMPKVSRPPISRMAVVDDGRLTPSHEDVGAPASPPGRPRRWHPLLAGGRTWTASASSRMLDSLVGDVLLDRADGDRAEAVVQRAGAFAQIDPAGRRGRRSPGSGIGLVRQLRRLDDAPVLISLQPVGGCGCAPGTSTRSTGCRSAGSAGLLRRLLRRRTGRRFP